MVGSPYLAKGFLDGAEVGFTCHLEDSFTLLWTEFFANSSLGCSLDTVATTGLIGVIRNGTSLRPEISKTPRDASGLALNARSQSRPSITSELSLLTTWNLNDPEHGPTLKVAYVIPRDFTVLDPSAIQSFVSPD